MNLALFDFDGTITCREMFADFVRCSVPPHRLQVGKVILAPFVVGYKLGVVPGVVVRSRVVKFGFRGIPQSHIDAVGLRFAQEVLPDVVRPEAIERIRWHRARGDVVAVVSGAFDCYLSHWCNEHGLELICSSLEVADGHLTGRYRGAQCVGPEKARRVRERYNLAEFAEVYAYGDTKEDLELLALASKRYYRWQEAA